MGRGDRLRSEGGGGGGATCESEAGAILILLAILAVVLITFVGLGVDTTLLGAAKRDETNLAPRVAAAALEAYANSVGTPVQKLEAARVRGQDIAQANVDIATTSSFLKGGRAAAVQDLGVSSTVGETGRIIPGVWHFMPTFQAPYFDPTTLACIGPSPCPCSSQTPGTWNGPCFEEITNISLVGSAGQPAAVTAMRAELKLRDDAPLRTRFMGIVGDNDEQMFSASSTVVQRKMHAVFILDLSRRVVAETHLPYEHHRALPGGGGIPAFAPAEYAYRLANPAACRAGEPLTPGPMDWSFRDGLLTCSLASPPPLPAPACAYSGSTRPGSGLLGPSTCTLAGGRVAAVFDGFYNQLFNHFCSNPLVPPVRNPAAHFMRSHSKADYRCIDVSYREAGGPPNSASYLVDLYRGQTRDVANYQGPEPLNSMLAGVARGLDKFRERRIDGDLFAILGVDQRADIDVRTFGIAPARDGEPEFEEARLTFGEPVDIVKRHREHMLFPREDALFNMPEALRQAYTLLTSQPDYNFVDNEVILITAGRSECVENTALSEHDCATDQATIERSIDESVAVVRNNFPNNKIRLHVIFADDLAGPHTRLMRGVRPESSNRCMDEEEARDLDPARVAADDLNYVAYRNFPVGDPQQDIALRTAKADTQFSADGTVTTASNYFFPNKLFDAASLTGGIWGAVRKSCAPLPTQLSGGNTCDQGGMEEWLDGQCAALPAPGDKLRNLSSGSVRVTDSAGRLLCDPTCRNKRQQIEKYIDKVFDRNPYLSTEINVTVQ